MNLMNRYYLALELLSFINAADESRSLWSSKIQSAYGVRFADTFVLLQHCTYCSSTSSTVFHELSQGRLKIEDTLRSLARGTKRKYPIVKCTEFYEKIK